VDGWTKIKQAAKYAGVSERTVRDWLKNGLKHSRITSGTVLIKYASIDAYLERFEVRDDQGLKLNEIANQTAREVLAR
jgi:excisionase family DNA binding protein